MRYLIVRLHILAIALLACVCLSTGTVYAIDQGGLGGRPARPQTGNPRSQSIFVHTLQAGSRATDAVQVINNTAETKKVLVYAVDSQISSGGAFACAQAADKPLGVGTWINLSQKEITLTPSSKQIVDFTIMVPKNATPGEHDGCIVIQDTKQQPAPDSNGIVLSLRSALRPVEPVPGKIQKGLVFTGLGFDHKTDEKILLSTALRNNGNVSLDTELDIKLLYPFGAAAVVSGGNFPVLSASEGRFNFEAHRPFWGGWYRLAAYAHYNDNPHSSLGEGKPTATIQRSSWIYIAPQPVAACIEVALLLLVVGGSVALVVRRRNHKWAMKHASTHIVRGQENLHTIASRYNMPWKYLARVNKLKPPYQLRVDQKLIVTSSRTNRKKLPQRP